jgi:hypothetical protein
MGGGAWFKPTSIRSQRLRRQTSHRLDAIPCNAMTHPDDDARPADMLAQIVTRVPSARTGRRG